MIPYPMGWRAGSKPMSLWLVIIAVAACLALGAASVFWWLGPERVWAFWGPADLGPVDFKTLERRTTSTDALACPSGFCPVEADIHPPAYPLDVPSLRKALARALLTERRLTRVDIDDRTPADRYVQRSEGLRFPDTIVVRYLDLPNGRSTVAIYSRSQIGRHDLGANHTRIERWLDKLSDEVARMKRQQ